MAILKAREIFYCPDLRGPELFSVELQRSDPEDHGVRVRFDVDEDPEYDDEEVEAIGRFLLEVATRMKNSDMQ